MDPWPNMTRLERDIARAGIVVVGIASLVGAALGWVGHQLVTHLHDPGISDHFRGGPR